MLLDCIEQGIRSAIAYLTVWSEVPWSSIVRWWLWWLGALVLWLIVFVGALAAGAFGLKVLIEELPWDIWSWLQGVLIALGTVLMLFLLSVLYRYTALIVAAPFISLMTREMAQILRVEVRLKDRQRSIWEDWYRGLSVALSVLWRELAWTVLLLALLLITGWGVVFTPLLFAVQAYYAGIAHADYIFEHFYDKRQTWQYVKAHRCAILANGTVFLVVILFIPCVGWLVGEILAAMAFAWYFLSDLAHPAEYE